MATKCSSERRNAFDSVKEAHVYAPFASFALKTPTLKRPSALVNTKKRRLFPAF
jgi:hypothetical protein